MTTINQKEYLKKYLSTDSEPSKKKKRKKKGTAISDRVKIIDDDIDVAIFNKAVEDDLHGEDAPQIVGVIDDRPLELRIDDYRKSDLWTPVGTQNATGLENVINETSPFQRQKRRNAENNRSRWDSSSERSPPRRNESPPSDVSPPRKNRTNEDNSPPRKRAGKNNKSRWNSSSERSPPRRNESPPLNKQPDFRRSRANDDDSHPRRSTDGNKIFNKSRWDSSNERSPPRRNASPPSDFSPLRRNRAIEDNSSPRRTADKTKTDTTDFSPPRRHSQSALNYDRKFDIHNRDSSRKRRDDDFSSSRRRRRDDDSSPSRRRRRDDDSSSSRGRRRNYNSSSSRERRHNDDSTKYQKSRRSRDFDSSPLRRNRDNNSAFKHERRDNVSSHYRKRSHDEINPHKGLSKDRSSSVRHPDLSHKKTDESNQSNTRRDSESTSKDNVENKSDKTTRTLDGKMAGLQNADELAKETDVWKKREDEMFKNMSAEVSGRNATAIVRDRRTGKIRDFQKEEEEESKKKEKEAENQEKYARWGKGLKQVEERDEKISNELYEMSKPLARYADDEDLERYLKEKEREGDPMLDYMRKKKKKKQDIEQKPTKPQYEGEFMPNRYGIRPGYRWDGVDRSNGYEKKWFEVLNSRRACQEEVYKWNTEDM